MHVRACIVLKIHVEKHRNSSLTLKGPAISKVTREFVCVDFFLVQSI